MPIKRGSTDVSFRVGSTAVSMIHRGASEMWGGYLLDLYGGASAAYSLRRLNSSYTGPIVQVRRSSDNAESTFSAADIAGGALAAWTGAGNDGFVKTLYDQSGNGRNMSQATAGRQPKVVSSGAVILQDGKPTLEFANSRADYLTTGDIGVNVPVDAYLVARFRAFSGNAGLRGLLAKAGATSGLHIRESFGTLQVGNGTILYSTNSATYVNTTRRIWNVYFDSGASSLFFINATQLASGNAGTNSPTGFALGTDAQITDRSGDVNIQEAIFYGSSQARRADVRSAMNQYYSVY